MSLKAVSTVGRGHDGTPMSLKAVSTVGLGHDGTRDSTLPRVCSQLCGTEGTAREACGQGRIRVGMRRVRL
jgi:hypothetical protein